MASTPSLPDHTDVVEEAAHAVPVVLPVAGAILIFMLAAIAVLLT